MNVRKFSIIACGFFMLQAFALAQTATDTAPQAEFQPMTQSEQFDHYVKSTFSVESLLRSAAGAGILQLTDTPHRVGTRRRGLCPAFRQLLCPADHASDDHVWASDLLHEDNRYVPSGMSGAGARLKYAVASAFPARKDDGTRRFSYSRMASSLSVAFISRE